MLTSDLLRVKAKGKKLLPEYIDPTNEQLIGLAETLLEVFLQSSGKPRYTIEDQLKEQLGTGTAFQLHRGLAKLLMDRCEFETSAVIEPVDLRAELFQAAANAYACRESKTLPERSQLIASVAEKYEATPEIVEQSMFADLKEEQVLARFKAVSASWLLERYNVALAQSLLLRATDMTVQIADTKVERYRALFRKLKFFQLMYKVQGSAEGGLQLRFDGPLSLFRSSNKYGLQLASFLPSILHCSDWQLKASILWGKRRVKREFTLSSEEGLKPYTQLTGQWQPEEMQFLPTQFEKLDTEWTISSEVELVDLGGEGLLVPDYVFHHPSTGRTVVMEIFGFWRRGAIASRLKLLKKHGPANLILAVSRELHIEEEELEELPHGVYLFRTTPVASQVLKLLDEF